MNLNCIKLPSKSMLWSSNYYRSCSPAKCSLYLISISIFLLGVMLVMVTVPSTLVKHTRDKVTCHACNCFT